MMYDLKDGEEHPIADIWNAHKWSDKKLAKVIDCFVVNANDGEYGDGFAIHVKPRFSIFYTRLGQEASRRISSLSRKLKTERGKQKGKHKCHPISNRSR